MGDARLGCVWLHDADSKQNIAALWPKGYRAAFNPVRVYDPDGVVVWREGVKITLSGGPSEVHVERIPAACRGRDLAWHGDLAWWVPYFRIPSEGRPSHSP